MWLEPARDLDKAIADAGQELWDQNLHLHDRDRLSERLDAFAARTLGTDETAVRERVRERLMELLRRSGLASSDLSLDLFDGARRESFREVGAAVQASGPLERVVSFLYRLQDDPVLHRVENLSVTPARDGEAVDLSFRYVTLVLNEPAPTTRPTTAPTSGPATPDRRLFDAIARRDLFRPYIKRPERPPQRVVRQPETRPSPPPQHHAPPPPPEEGFRVVGLPMLDGKPLVHLHDPRSGIVRTYEVGDRVGQVSIAGVDYRRMRWGQTYSTSRVLLRQGVSYWAVELGNTLGQKRPLRQQDLPQELRRAPTTAPAAEADGDGQAKG
jgi:hypothetical protein